MHLCIADSLHNVLARLYTVHTFNVMQPWKVATKRKQGPAAPSRVQQAFPWLKRGPPGHLKRRLELLGVLEDPFNGGIGLLLRHGFLVKGANRVDGQLEINRRYHDWSRRYVTVWSWRNGNCG